VILEENSRIGLLERFILVYWAGGVKIEAGVIYAGSIFMKSKEDSRRLGKNCPGLALKKWII